MAGETVHEPARETPVLVRAEVVVVGGGPSGIAAAVAAARAGATTVLVERYGFLGGSGTAAMVTNFCGLHANVRGEVRRVVRGIADEILARLGAMGALNREHSVLGKTAAQSYDNAAYKCVADDLVTGAGVELWLHALAAGAVCENDRVCALVVETKSGRGAIVGEVFVDASGDADLAAWAGVPYDKGDDDGYLAYPTTMFRMGGVDTPRALAEGKPNLRALMSAAEAEGVTFPRRAAYINPQAHAGEWRANATQIARPDGRSIDATDARDLSYAEVEGRRQVLAFFDFLRARVPGFEAAYLLDIAPQVGVRETRRVRGLYRLTGDDVLSSRDFADTIGVNGWPVERHVRGDVEWRWAEGRGYHQIPYRCLVPERVTNLLVAGRCASSTQDGHASLRVSGPCFEMGQAAGVAAALCLRTGATPATLDIARLQAHLRAEGCFLGDPND